MTKAELLREIEEIEVVYYADLDHDKIYNGVKPFSEAGFEAFRNYVNAQDAVYYAKDDEDFDLLEGIQKAIKEGKKRVIVENLS
jgi:hypothetical protein